MALLMVLALLPVACGGGGGGGGGDDGGPPDVTATTWLVVGMEGDLESGDPFALDRATLSEQDGTPRLTLVDDGVETNLTGTRNGDRWTFVDTSGSTDTTLEFQITGEDSGTLTLRGDGGAETVLDIYRLKEPTRDASGVYRITIANPEGTPEEIPEGSFYRTLVQEPGTPSRITLMDPDGDFTGFATGDRYYLTRMLTDPAADEEDPNVALLLELEFVGSGQAEGRISEVQWANVDDGDAGNDFMETAEADLSFSAAQFAGDWLLVGFDLNDLRNDDQVALVHPVIFTQNDSSATIDLGGGTVFDGTVDGQEWTFTGTQEGRDIEVLTLFTNEAVGAIRIVSTDPADPENPLVFDAELYRIVPAVEDATGQWTMTYANPRGTNPDFPASTLLTVTQSPDTPAELSATSPEGTWEGYATANFYFLVRRQYAGAPSDSNPNEAELLRISMEGPDQGSGTADTVRWAEPDFREVSGADVVLTR